MKALFLDTATQIARHWHSDSERKRIDQQLKGRTSYCSHYVKCQYKATLLNSSIGLHNLLMYYKDLRRALREARAYRNADIAGIKLTLSVQQRILAVGLWMLEYYEEYEEQLFRLGDLIDNVWETQFHQGLEEPLVDETCCLYAAKAPEQGASGVYKPIDTSCTIRNPQDCKIVAFWNNHRIQLKVLFNMNINSIKVTPKDPKELERIKTHAGKITVGELAHGLRCTVHLSDAIICIESTHCPEPVAVHSTNKKHFLPLGEVLGLECEPDN